MSDTVTTVPCRLCGRPTTMQSTSLCDSCWELDSKIRSHPEIARKILAELVKEDELVKEELRRLFGKL